MHLSRLAALTAFFAVLLAPIAVVSADEAADWAAVEQALQAVQRNRSEAGFRSLREATEKYLANNPEAKRTHPEHFQNAVRMNVQLFAMLNDDQGCFDACNRHLEGADGQLRLFLLYFKGASAVKLGRLDDARAVLATMRATEGEMAEMATQAAAELEGMLRFAPGAEPPAFTLPDLDGKEHSLADFKGKIVLVDFWATWCGPCRTLMRDHLKGLHDKFADKGLVVIGISNEDAAVQKRFADSNNYDWLKLRDARNTAGEAYGVRGIPHLVLVDKDGKIVVAGSGFAVIEQVAKYIAEHLDK